MRIEIERDVSLRAVSFWFIKSMPGEREIIAEPVELVWREVSDTGQEISPTLTLPYREARSFMEGMIKALEAHGVETESRSYERGQLEAQGRHLGDLRSMLDLK